MDYRYVSTEQLFLRYCILKFNKFLGHSFWSLLKELSSLNSELFDKIFNKCPIKQMIYLIESGSLI